MKSAFFSRSFFPTIVTATYLFLYIPIILLIVFSFNSNAFTFSWHHFTVKWYRELFASTELWIALKNSLLVAGSAVVLSISMAVLLVFYSGQRYRKKIPLFFSGNLAIPEIVLAIGMLSFFSFFSIPIGLTTVVVGHTLVGLGYVIPIVYDRYKELDRRFTDASLDLGATLGQTLRYVIFPMLFPALVAASLLVFIVSLDDFVIAFFCAGATAQTLPLYIFSMIRGGSSPIVSALSVVLLGLSSLLVIVSSSLRVKKMVLPK